MDLLIRYYLRISRHDLGRSYLLKVDTNDSERSSKLRMF